MSLRYTVRINFGERKPVGWTAQAEYPVGTPYTYTTDGLTVLVDFAPDEEAEQERPLDVETLLGVLDDFDRWAGVDPATRFYAIDKHGAHWAKFLDLLRTALSRARKP